MSYPLLEPRRRRMVAIAVGVFGALALASGEPARGEVSVADEQAEASAVAAEALDAARYEASAITADTDTGDATLIGPIDWSEAHQAMTWFPVTMEEDNANGDDTRASLLALAPSPMRTPGLTSQAVAPQPTVIPNEYAVIPLPSAAWTGLAGLASLATIGGRKALMRFFCS